MFKKKTKKSIKAEIKKEEAEIEAPIEPRISTENIKVVYFRKKMQEATDPQKMEEYKFWMETHQGKNPSLPAHMH